MSNDRRRKKEKLGEKCKAHWNIWRGENGHSDFSNVQIYIDLDSINWRNRHRNTWFAAGQIIFKSKFIQMILDTHSLSLKIFQNVRNGDINYELLGIFWCENQFICVSIDQSVCSVRLIDWLVLCIHLISERESNDQLQCIKIPCK